MKSSTSSNIHMTRVIPGIEHIINDYDAFIIDQWGVLHNGKSPYEGVLHCLSQIHSRRKPMILLSNSSKRKSESVKGLKKVGIDPSLFADIITSGELGWHMLRDRNLAAYSASSRRDSSAPLKLFVIGNGDDDKDYIQSSGCVFASPLECELILARGTFSLYTSSNPLECRNFPVADDLIQSVSPFLAQCAQRKIPMLVTNPDNMRPGSNSPMPGQIAAMYDEMLSSRANIEYVGKPHKKVYEECNKSLETLLSSGSRICCIGDSIEHDIKGARSYGFDSLWIVNGVHSNEMNSFEACQEVPEMRSMQAVIEKYGGTVPSWSIASFRW